MAIEFNNNDVIVKALTATGDVAGRRLQVGTNNTILPGAANSHILGDNIIAALSGFVYVNNLSATGNLIAKNLNNVSITLGAGDQESNLAIGVSALNNNTIGTGNIGIGRNALANTTSGIERIVIINPGIGYSTTPFIPLSSTVVVYVTGGGATPNMAPTTTATFQPIVSGNIVRTISAWPLYTLQSISADRNYSSTLSAISSFNGIISEVRVTNRGMGYFFTPTVIISGGFEFGQPFTFVNAVLSAAFTTSRSNIAIGLNAGRTVQLGEDNILIGTNAGSEITLGNDNVIIGHNNIAHPDSQGNIIIGNNNELSGFSNVILLGTGLSANKSNFAFISALDVKRLEVGTGNFGSFLTVDESGISATQMVARALTAQNLTVGKFYGNIDLYQISQSNALSGQVAYYDGNAWVPSNVIPEYPGTRLYDFQLTAWDPTITQILTADTAYCGVAPIKNDLPPSTGESVWRITRIKFNDGGSPFETGITVNTPWSARYIANYLITS